MLDFINEGTHSFVFQAPLILPAIWPSRKEMARNDVLRDTRASSCSPTHFDSLYPVPAAISAAMSSSSAGLDRSMSIIVQVVYISIIILILVTRKSTYDVERPRC
jgi:hypothetical protein